MPIIKSDENVCPRRTQTLCSSLEAFHVFCLCFLFEDSNTQDIVLVWVACLVCQGWEDPALRRYLISKKETNQKEISYNIIYFFANYSRHLCDKNRSCKLAQICLIASVL